MNLASTIPDNLRAAFRDSNLKIAIIVSDFNREITQSLYHGAEQTCLAAGFTAGQLTRFNVPGAFEIPVAAHLIHKARFDALICLGCIIQGETDHHQFIGQPIFQQLSSLACSQTLPLGVGILTTKTVAQALARSTGEHNRGIEAAVAALTLLALKKELKVTHV